MKTRNLFLGAMGLLAMASCSNDELVSVNHDGDEIAFNVVTNASTRVDMESGGVYCNINLPKTFYVWATHEDEGSSNTYIEGDKIEIGSASDMLAQANPKPQEPLRGLVVQHNLIANWVNKSGTRYWPDKGSLNFYASVNALSNDDNYKFKWNGGTPTVEVTVPMEVAKQKDLLYAVKTNQTKADNSGKDDAGKERHVNLNFRHALSQVVFTAMNTNENLYVEIDGVSICNVMSKNTFTYPTANTDDNIDHHDENDKLDNNTIASYDGSWGTWGSANTAINYSLTFDLVKLTGKSDPNALPTSLTPNFEEEGENGTTMKREFSDKAMLLLPQNSTAWDVKANPTVLPENQTGTYFLVKCRIFNVAKTTVDLDNSDGTADVCLWGNKEDNGTYTTKNIAIPVKLEWTQGKKYIYNFMFGTSGSAVDPEHPENPILVPITFRVTVDDFVPVDAIDVPSEDLIEDAESSIID